MNKILIMTAVVLTIIAGFIMNSFASSHSPCGCTQQSNYDQTKER